MSTSSTDQEQVNEELSTSDQSSTQTVGTEDTSENHRPARGPQPFVLKFENGMYSLNSKKLQRTLENMAWGKEDTCQVVPGLGLNSASNILRWSNPPIDGKFHMMEPANFNIGQLMNNYSPSTLFAGLRVDKSGPSDNAALNYKRSRRPSPDVSVLPTMPSAYVPHVSVTQPELKFALFKIALVCQFLDTAFAEYFRAVVSHSDGIIEKLNSVRQQICSRQATGTDFVGPFGSYCERISALGKNDLSGQMEKFQARVTGDDVQPYLQDALEVPYWEIMVDQFIKSVQVNSAFTYDIVLCVINDKRQELKRRLQQIEAKSCGTLPQPIVDGILRRIALLDALLAQTTNGYDSLEEGSQSQPLQQSSSPDPYMLRTQSGLHPLGLIGEDVNNISDLEKVSLLTLFMVFTAVAMVPFSMGFAGFWKADHSVAYGSVSDPGFKCQIATTLLAIFGNMYAIVPLRKMTRGSTANVISQGLLYFSIVLGIFGVAVYPFWNKAWSSSLSFFCSFFAIGSVFTASQYLSSTASYQATKGPKPHQD